MSNAVEKPKYVGVLLNLMGERRESQNDLAKAIGTNRDKVNNWIAYRSKIDFENLIKIAQHYDVTTDYLLGLTTVRKQNATLRSIEEYTGLTSEAIENLKRQSSIVISDLSKLLVNDKFISILSRLDVLRFLRNVCVNALELLSDLSIEELTQLRYGDTPISLDDVRLSILEKRDALDDIHEYLTPLRLEVFDLYGMWSDCLESFIPTKEEIADGKTLYEKMAKIDESVGDSESSPFSIEEE